MVSDYTEAQYRADIRSAIKEWPWLLRPLAWVAIWITEMLEGTPDHPGLQKRYGRGKR